MMRNAHYDVKPDDLLDAARQVTEKLFAIADFRPNRTQTFRTESLWYTRDGARSQLKDKTLHPGGIKLGFVVAVVADADGSQVIVTPVAFSHDENSVALVPLVPDRIDWPTWIDGNTETVVTEIYKATRAHVAKPVANPLRNQPAL
jgi:hypothetical protein